MEIENVSYDSVANGTHKNHGNDTILIRILDNDNNNPASPKYDFCEIREFYFMDVDEDTHIADNSFRFNTEMAKEMVCILKKAKKENKNIVVHCTLGMCRSGAVTEIGTMLGFYPVHNSRIPNSHVKKLMMRELGWTYD